MAYVFNPFTGTLDNTGSGGASGVSDVSNSDGTLTISPTTGSVIASINLSNANTWLIGQAITASSGSNTALTLKAGSAPSVSILNFRDSSNNVQNCFDSNFAWACTPTSTAQLLQARSRTGMGGVGGDFTFEIKRDGTNNYLNGVNLKLTDNASSANLKWFSSSFSQNIMDFELHTAPGRVYASPSTGGNFYYNPLVNTQRISILEIPTQTMSPGAGTTSPQGLFRIQVCPIAATSPNSLVDTASLWIEGAPTQSVNMTMTNRYAALFQAGDDEGIPLGLRTAASQITNAFQIEDPAGAVLLGIDALGHSITSEAEGLQILQLGDSLGATGFEIGNRGGFNGATLTNYSLDLVDFIYQASTGGFKVNWRYEARTSENLPLNNSSGEFQMLFSAGGGGNALSIGRGAAVFYPYVPGTGIDGSDGVVGVYRADPQAQFHVESRDATTVTQIIQAATSQSVNMLEFWNDADAPMAYVSEAGTASFQGFGLGVATKTGTYTAADEGTILCDASSGAFSINLPAAASSANRIYSIKKIDSSVNIVTIDGDASETIDGALTLSLIGQYQSVTVTCNGSNWFII